ncbi:MAG: primosomal protein N' [Burkholderiaceae bacterium]|nr:MAG: primosomal protein N' [Burkholderiaceae bacterium]
MSTPILRVALDAPLLPGWFDYRLPAGIDAAAVAPGTRVLVPWGRRTVIGIVVGSATESALPLAKLKPVIAVLDDVPVLPASWLALGQFAAQYYQRPLGEVLLPALPTLLRRASGYKQAEPNGPWRSASIKGLLKRLTQTASNPPGADASAAPALNVEQAEAVEALARQSGFQTFLLHGVTGSGKTEVYLHAVAAVLARGQQALILVPEINLTPQLLHVFQQRFPDIVIASLHSHLADGERALAWLQAQTGQARIVLGTRLAIFTPVPQLGLIVVDEEHDPSFKQQEGLRYSARDLAVYRAHQENIPVVLGSATPSLESWLQVERGKYRRLALTQRAVAAANLPAIRMIDMQRHKANHGLTEPVLGALKQTLERGEQALVFLNRRGYAPVLSCTSCGWVSSCKACSAFMVWHKLDGRLRCHHCSAEHAVPRHCPACGNVDLAPLGRGTQRIEEHLQTLFPQARISRVDRDSTRRKHSVQELLAQAHAGEIDILVGTQMLAKGHDFQRLSLVAVVNPDTALFSQDYRAAERLFAQLMQVAGRAGRAATAGQVLLQTRYPQHPLYQALTTHDYAKFAQQLLQERQQAGWPPYAHQAVLRAEAATLEAALNFLQQAQAALNDLPGILVYDSVPMRMARLAGQERAQLLFESTSRPALQQALTQANTWLHAQKTRVRWSLEVDPQEI